MIKLKLCKAASYKLFSVCRVAKKILFADLISKSHPLNYADNNPITNIGQIRSRAELHNSIWQTIIEEN